MASTIPPGKTESENIFHKAYIRQELLLIFTVKDTNRDLLYK